MSPAIEVVDDGRNINLNVDGWSVRRWIYHTAAERERHTHSAREAAEMIRRAFAAHERRSLAPTPNTLDTSAINPATGAHG